MYLYDGDLEEAEKTVIDAVVSDPGSRAARNAQGRIMQALGKPEAAAAAFVELARLQEEKDAELRRKSLAGNVVLEIVEAWKARRYEEMEPLVTRAMPLVTTSQQRQLLVLLARMYDETGRPQQAEEMRRRAAGLGGGAP